MEKKHKKPLNVSNHMQSLVGQPYYKKKPSLSRIIEGIVSSMAKYDGTMWAPVAYVKKGKAPAWDLMINQCPGACGQVWRLEIEDEDVVNWITNEVNQRRSMKTEVKMFTNTNSWEKIEKEFKDKLYSKEGNVERVWLPNADDLLDFFRHQFQKLVEESEPERAFIDYPDTLVGNQARHENFLYNTGIQAYKENLLKRIK